MICCTHCFVTLLFFQISILHCVVSLSRQGLPPPLPPYTPAPFISPRGNTVLQYAITPANPAGYSPYFGHTIPSKDTPIYYQSPEPHLPAVTKKRKEPTGSVTPSCSRNTTKTWCLTDGDYPTYDIQHAIKYHYAAVASLYKDVIANTDNSVDRLKYLSEETYLCPSETAYEMPLRAINTEGKWRIIVNRVKAHYEMLSQTVRFEECTTPGYQCPLVPSCYDTKCFQKHAYHRLLIYDPYDYYVPFSIETFKLPSACSCYNAASAKHI